METSKQYLPLHEINMLSMECRSKKNKNKQIRSFFFQETSHGNGSSSPINSPWKAQAQQGDRTQAAEAEGRGREKTAGGWGEDGRRMEEAQGRQGEAEEDREQGARYVFLLFIINTCKSFLWIEIMLRVAMVYAREVDLTCT